MKTIAVSFFALVAFSCSNAKNKPPTSQIEHIVIDEFQTILDSFSVVGSILILDESGQKYYSNDYEWSHTQKLPASTFKIPHSIIALESGVLANDSVIFVWDGEKRALKNWEQDLKLNEAFHFSCVPCYQEVARSIGADRMHNYLNQLQYGSIVLDSLSIDSFWLKGNSGISQFQQIDFLRRLYGSQLPIANKTENSIKKIMIIDEVDDLTLSGKTGWSNYKGIDNGWYVGRIQKLDKVYYFATNIQPQTGFDITKFAPTRKSVTHKAFKSLGFLDYKEK